jgi:hypothetical protein
MNKLKDEDFRLEESDCGKYVFASLYEDKGYRCWERYHIENLPNENITLDLLNRFHIPVGSK